MENRIVLRQINGKPVCITVGLTSEGLFLRAACSFLTTSSVLYFDPGKQDGLPLERDKTFYLLCPKIVKRHFQSIRQFVIEANRKGSIQKIVFPRTPYDWRRICAERNLGNLLITKGSFIGPGHWLKESSGIKDRRFVELCDFADATYSEKELDNMSRLARSVIEQKNCASLRYDDMTLVAEALLNENFSLDELSSRTIGDFLNKG